MELSELYTSNDGVSLMWMGNNGWVINFHGTVISTDLDLHLSIRKPLPPNVDLKEMASQIQIASVTHGHGDHLNPDTCLFLQKHSDCLFVIPKSCYRIATEIGLDDKRVVVATPGVHFQLMGLDWLPVRALHGHFLGSVYSGASLGDCGYVISHDGFSLYQPGDTVLLEEHFDMKDIDLLFFSPTEHNMHIENSLRFIKLIGPRYIFPQHYDSYECTPENAFWTKGFVDEVYERLSREQKDSFVRIPQGQPFRVEG